MLKASTRALVLSAKLVKPCQSSLVVQSRSTSFFNKLTAAEIWKGVTSVSNAGRKRGRGKGAGKRVAKNLNRGQIIGVGRENMVWPGLNSPILAGRELNTQKKLSPDPKYQENLQRIRDTMGRASAGRLRPVDRGWSGRKLPGRSIGQPDSLNPSDFAGFDTRVLEFKTVFNMTATFGRKRSLSAFVITGNKKGLAGFALGKANNGQTALKSAKNRAAQKLMYIPLYNNHTVYHDFFTQFGKTKIHVRKCAEGHGLVCHRALKTICEVIGIKDLYAKVEGSTKNYQNLAKAFFIGLLQQRTFETLADDQNLFVVERRKEMDNYPLVVGKPSGEPLDIPSSKVPDYNLVIMNGKVPLEKRKFPKFYQIGVHEKRWNVHLSKTVPFRNMDSVRTRIRAEYGELRSFLMDKFPECRTSRPGENKKIQEEEETV
ncbi:small ribosomal subunit protein uS5m-like isoform X2 [Artemia franciscana]|uniref:Small ribosomal subunit protein uS5m n=1 Tax=Artemia franciscana TaxID=6661 RepID=A0AA88HGH1_ARTSF|nr:hypothetical protein QYM36_017283 [Artemia franciscana]